MSEPVGHPVAMLELGTEEQPAEARTFPRGGWLATWILVFSLSATISSMLVLGLRSPHGFFVPVLAIAVCVLAALLDASTRRIPNKLTYVAIIAGLAINVFAAGLAHGSGGHPEGIISRWLGAPGIAQSLLGFAVCAGLGILGAMARIGGGDIKLLAALGALLGLSQMGAVLLVALTVALVYAVANLALRGRLNSFLQFLSLRTLEVLYFHRIDLPSEVSDAEHPKRQEMIPMAIPLAIGLIIAQVIDVKAQLGFGS